MRKENFAKNLKQIREFLDYTKAEVAKRSGMTASAICNFESGIREPSLSSLVKLSNTLGVTLDRLVFGKE